MDFNSKVSVVKKISFIYCFIWTIAQVFGQIHQPADVYLNRVSQDIVLTLEDKNDFYEHLNFKRVYKKFEQEDKRFLNEKNARQFGDYEDIVVGLMLEDNRFENKAVSYLNSSNDKRFTDKLTFYLSLYFFNKKEFQRCLQLLNRMTYENLSNEQIVYLKFIAAYAHFENREYDKSFVLFDLLRQIQDHNPFYFDANYYYGFLELKLLNNVPYALSAFKKIEPSPYYQKIVPFYIAHLMYFSGLKVKTLHYLDNVLTLYKDLEHTDDLTNLMIQLYYETQQFVLCKNKILQKSTLSINDEFYLGVSYYQLDQLDDALKVFKKINTNHDSLLFYMNFYLGKIYLKKKDKKNARNCFYYCKDFNPNKIHEDYVSYQYAKLSLELGMYQIALQELTLFSGQFKNSVYYDDVKTMLLWAYTNTSNYKAAVALINELQGRNKNKDTTINNVASKIYYGRGTDYLNESNTDSARYFFNKAIQMNGVNAYAAYSYYCLGDIEYHKNNYTKALIYFQNGLKRKQQSQDLKIKITDVYYMIAYCYFKQDNFVAALPYFEKAYRTSVESDYTDYEKDAYLRAADCQFMVKKYRTAKEMYLQYSKTFTTGLDYAYYQLAMIEGIYQPQEKIRLLNEYVRRFPQSNMLLTTLLEVGSTEMSLKMFVESIRTFQTLMVKDTLQKYRPMCLLNIGLSYNNLDSFDQSRLYFKTIVEQFSNTAEAEQAIVFLKDIYLADGTINDYFDYLKKMGKYVENAENDSLAFIAAEIKYREKKYNEAFQLFNSYLGTFANGLRRLQGFYYLLHISYFNKTYDAMYLIMDSISVKGMSKYLEKSLVLMNKVPENMMFRNINKHIEYNKMLYKTAQSEDNKWLGLKNLMNNYYTNQDWQNAMAYAPDIKKQPQASNWEKAIASWALAKKYYYDTLYAKASEENNIIIKLVHGHDMAAEALYYNALIAYTNNQWDVAEKKSFEVINHYSQAADWVIRAYLLLADVYLKQNDFYNAKATLKSIIANVGVEKYKALAEEKLAIAENQEIKNQQTPFIKNKKDTGIQKK